MAAHCNALLAWVLASACSSSVPVQSYTYACNATAQCASGWSCVAGRCAQGAGTATVDVGVGSDDDVARNADTGTEQPTTGPETVAETAADAKPVCTAADINCLTTCAVSSCPMQAFACNQDPDCMKFLTCYVACKDTSCRFNCIGSAPAGTKTKAEDLAKCLAASCM